MTACVNWRFALSGTNGMELACFAFAFEAAKLNEICVSGAFWGQIAASG